MSALFKADEVTKELPQQPNSEKFGVEQPIGSRNTVSNRHALGSKSLELEKVIGDIQKDETIHCLSLGNWSMHHLIEYLLNITGSAEVIIMTWSIKNTGVQTLLRLQEQGQITDLKCVFDNRVKAMCPEAWQLAENNIPCRLTKNHSKVTIIRNEQFSIAVISSANMTHNPRIEAYVITESKPTADYYANVINQVFEGSKPFHQ